MRFKIVRVVTVSHVVPWHLHNMLMRAPADFDVCIVGSNVSPYKVFYPHVKFFDLNISRKPSVFFDFLSLIKLTIFFIKFKPHVVHSVMPKSGLLSAIAGRISRVPVRMHTFTGQTWVADIGLSRYIYYWGDRLINSLNSICLTDSPSQSQFLFANNFRHNGKPLEVLLKGSLSGVDMDRFNLQHLSSQAEQLRIELDLPRDQFIFSYIARKTSAKGALDMLRAFSVVLKAYPESKLLFVGPDEDGDIFKLRNSNPTLFINVIEVGAVKNHEVYLAISDVLCLPSYREGFGSIVIEAAALGVPTIGSRIPGLTDSVMDKNTGILVPAGNMDELVNSMEYMVANPIFRKRCGQLGRERVADFFTADGLYLALKNFYLKYLSVNSDIGTQ